MFTELARSVFFPDTNWKVVSFRSTKFLSFTDSVWLATRSFVSTPPNTTHCRLNFEPSLSLVGQQAKFTHNNGAIMSLKIDKKSCFGTHTSHTPRLAWRKKLLAFSKQIASMATKRLVKIVRFGSFRCRETKCLDWGKHSLWVSSGSKTLSWISKRRVRLLRYKVLVNVLQVTYTYCFCISLAPHASLLRQVSQEFLEFKTGKQLQMSDFRQGTFQWDGWWIQSKYGTCGKFIWWTKASFTAAWKGNVQARWCFVSSTTECSDPKRLQHWVHLKTV